MTTITHENRNSSLNQSPTVSIVIPIFNEAEVLPVCLQRLTTVMASLGESYELVFIDDGSRDASADYLIQQSLWQPAITLVRLSRNFGKEAAMTAGMDQAAGEAIIVLDADLQDPPELIPSMLRTWREGADVVLMRRRSRAGESWLKRLSAYLFYRLLARMSHCEIPEDTGDFRLLSRRAVQALQLLPERNRFMKGLFAWIGMETRVLVYDRAPRAAGRTKWNYFRLFGLALEAITSFSTSPLRWASVMGILTAGFGTVFGTSILLETLWNGQAPDHHLSLIAMLAFIGGVQLLTIGVLGEYVGKTYIESKRRPPYLIEDLIRAGRSDRLEEKNSRLTSTPYLRRGAPPHDSESELVR